MKSPVLRVAAKALIIDKDGKILLLREAKTYKDGTNIGRYHLPGGRLETGEPFYEGLAREVREETGLDVQPIKPLYVGEWYPVIRETPHHIIAMFMLCSTLGGGVKLSEEHDDFAWIDPKNVAEYDVMGPENEVIKAYLEMNN